MKQTEREKEFQKVQKQVTEKSTDTHMSFKKLTKRETWTVEMQNHTKTQKQLSLLKISREIMGAGAAEVQQVAIITNAIFSLRVRVMDGFLHP